MADAVMRLLGCLPSPLDSHILGPQLVREIIFRALRSEQGNALRAVAGRHSGYGRMARPCGASTPTTPVRWTSTPWLARRT